VRTLNEGFSSPSRIRQSQDNIEVDSKTNQATSVRIWGESIRSDVLFKVPQRELISFCLFIALQTTFVTSSTVVEEVIQIVLKKYQVPKGDNEFALWEEKDTGEVRRLGDQEPLIPIINAWGETDKYHYKLSLRRKPESQRVRPVQPFIFFIYFYLFCVVPGRLRQGPLGQQAPGRDHVADLAGALPSV